MGPESSEAALPAPAGALEACIRDLMGLLALPALWTGREPRAILSLLCEALESVLPLQACYAGTRFSEGGPPVAVLRVRGNAVDADDPSWHTLTDACMRSVQGARSIAVEDTPLGPLQMLRLEMDYHTGSGVLCVAASDPAFPTTTQSAFLRAAATLAASGLQNARLAREREEASRAKDEFLAMLGHELRNPLAPIVTALNLIKLRSANRLTREQEIIERQVGHLTRLVDDLLDISRITRGKVELKHELLEISTVVAKAIETASPLLEQRRHHLQLEVPASGLKVIGDPTRLAQVVANLLTNAAKYTEPGGKVRVHARREGDNVCLSVKDTGVGIPEDLLPRVFDIFHQGRRTIDRAEGGLGIGLALVKSLTQIHGGTVAAASDGPGAGSEFTIRLPAALPRSESESALSPEPAAEPAGPRERVLVVDDNRDAADLIAELLRTVGHEVFVAHDAFEALSLAERVEPSVMVLDIGLPVMDGYEVARRVRERLDERAPRLIALTGYGLDNDRARSFALGFEGHLVKPVAADDLFAAVSGPEGGTAAVGTR